MKPYIPDDLYHHRVLGGLLAYMAWMKSGTSYAQEAATAAATQPAAIVHEHEATSTDAFVRLHEIAGIDVQNGGLRVAGHDIAVALLDELDAPLERFRGRRAAHREVGERQRAEPTDDQDPQKHIRAFAPQIERPGLPGRNRLRCLCLLGLRQHRLQVIDQTLGVCGRLGLRPGRSAFLAGMAQDHA